MAISSLAGMLLSEAILGRQRSFALRFLHHLLGLSFFFTAALSAPTFASGPTAEAILEKADRARGGLSEGLRWKINLASSGGGQAAEYDVKVKGVNVIARCESPARQKGETFLFNDRNLWIYRPGLKKPVSLSPRQRLSGQAANGDIATTNYARDYVGEIEGKETVEGKATFRLLLKAKDKNVTYDKIRYWVTQDTYLGVKAEFLTLEGKVFKRAKFAYEHKLAVAGKNVPFVSRMDITDAMNEASTTSILYQSPSAEPLSDTIFNVNNLTR
ncbi:MAG: outer membrane lipoprotein-sorting protein [Proteobacteria bacterium]|nr:MAG: outer membrane lipoprotein-sorting protein [Pseudomonadota bacterium]